MWPGAEGPKMNLVLLRVSKYKEIKVVGLKFKLAFKKEAKYVQAGDGYICWVSHL